MAKIERGLIRLQGTIHDLTFVNSKAYRAHVRAPRGTYRKAKCNAALTRNFQRTAVLVRTAKPVFEALKETGKDCRESFLWQHIMSRFRKCESNQPVRLLQMLEGLELNRKYPLLPLFDGSLKVTTVTEEKKILVTITADCHPSALKKVTDYRFAVQLLYCYESRKVFSSESQFTDWISMNDKAAAPSFSFPERTALCCLVCMRLEARKAGVPEPDFLGSRMCVVHIISL
jgi:hypothetical protein